MRLAARATTVFLLTPCDKRPEKKEQKGVLLSYRGKRVSKKEGEGENDSIGEL